MHLKVVAYEKMSLLPIANASYEFILSTFTKWYKYTCLAAQFYCHNILNLHTGSICSVAAMQEFVDSLRLNYYFLKSLNIEDMFQMIVTSLLLF